MPHPTVLTGARVQLVPLEREHIPHLLSVGQQAPGEFDLTSTPVTQEETAPYYDEVLANRERGTAYPFTVLLQSSAEVIGLTRFNAMDFRNRNLEIGYTWYRSDQFGTATNTECKLLMLTFAFEQLGMHRVSLRTDVLNVRSRKAIEALGAKFEGVMRRHMLARGGRVRDTALYAITDQDWPEVKVHIQERLRRKLTAAG